MLEFRTLGPFEVLEDGQPLVLGGPRQRALLAILLLHRGEVVSSDRLIDELWGERPPATAVKTLQGYVSRLRRALGEGVLLTERGGYALDVTGASLDAEQFERLVSEARRALRAGDAGRARELLKDALELWRGEALADLAYEPFAQGETARLEEMRLTALEDRVEAELALGRHRELVGELGALVTQHPRRERMVGQLMLSLYRCGRHTDALDVYRGAREALEDELGLEPGPELRALEQQILTHDASLDARPGTASLPQPPALPAPSTPEPEPATARGGVRPGLPLRAHARPLAMTGGALLLIAAVAATIVATTSGGGATAAPPNSVAAIDTRTDEVVGHAAVGARPGAIAYGSGSLWVANLDDRTVSRVDPATLRTLRSLAVGGLPMGLARAGAAIWVAASSPGATSVSASRIDPEFDTIDRTAAIGSVVPGSAVSAAARGLTLWVAPSSGELTSLASDTGRIERRIDPNAAPAAVGVGADAVWVTDSEADNVERVDATGLVTSIPVGHTPSGIAVGEGGVWVADTGDDAVVRIDPETRAVTATIPVGNSPTGVAVGAGSVWVANSGAGTVTRIDPARGTAIATIVVGGSPQQIVVAGDRVWATVDAPTLPRPGSAVSGGTLRVVATYDVTAMDPALAYDALSWELLYASCARLLNYPDKSGPESTQLVPEVAQSLPAKSADGRSYTFTIRGGFRFSPPSNAAVTAQTFKDTIERSLNPEMKSPVAGEFRDIVGARAYIAGRAPHISGVVARGNVLTLRLLAPAPDLLARIAEPAMCAVPPNTPIDPSGVHVIPSAGPYRVASYAPGQGVVLTRNPNYAGSRPHVLERIEVSVKISAARAISRVEAGKADYAIDGTVTSADAARRLAQRYGRASAAAAKGRQQYFERTTPELDFLTLNSERPLFHDVQLRKAVNFAIDRAALARAGDPYTPLADAPADHYLPPGVPGYRDVHLYASTPDLREARRFARGHAASTAVLYTCDQRSCEEQAQIIKTDLAAIGLRIEVKRFPIPTLYAKLATPGEPFDIGAVSWLLNYPDPDAMLNYFLESRQVIPPLADPGVAAHLSTAAQLSGPDRYLTYARLDAELARTTAPLVAYGSSSAHELFSARIGCQSFGAYGTDIAALCVRNGAR